MYNLLISFWYTGIQIYLNAKCIYFYILPQTAHNNKRAGEIWKKY